MHDIGVNNNGEKLSKYISTILFFIIVVIISLNIKVAEIEEVLKQYERFGVAICLIAYILLGVTPIPTEPLALLILTWKGPLAAILIATLGNTFAAIVEFFIGGSIGGITNFEQKREKLPFHLGRLPINSPAFLILGRMLPGFGPKFVSIVCGVYQVPIFTYLWTTLIANLIGASIFVLSSYGVITLVQ